MEDLIKSLKTIKNVCINRDRAIGCKGCPLGNQIGECMIISTIPEYWQIQEPQEVVRLLR